MGPPRNVAAGLGELARQQKHVVAGFLWTLLTILAVASVANVLLVGRALLAPAPLVAHAVAFGALALAIRLNRAGRSRIGASLGAGLVMVSASLPPLVLGVEASAPALMLFFIPMVVAGLLIDRFALGITTVWALAVVLAAPLLHGDPLMAADGPSPAWTLALQFALVLVMLALLLDRFGLRFQRAMRRALQVQARAEEALRDEIGFTDAVVESLPGLFFVRDENGRYVRWNRRFEAASGYSEAELLDMDPLDLVVPEEREGAAAALGRVATEGSAYLDVHLLSKQGESLPYFISGTKVERDGRTYLVGTGIDRSEVDAARSSIEALNAELREKVARLSALRDIDRAIVGSLDLELTLGVMLDQVIDKLGVDGARILLFDDGSQELRHGASSGLHVPGTRRLRVPLGEPPGGVAALERRTVRLARDELVAGLDDATAEALAAFASYVGVPLVAKGQLQGVLEVFSRAPAPDTADWNDFLEALAMQAAIGVSNATLFEDLERSNIELRLAYDTTIEGWARALDLKDQETEGHSRRVTELAVQLGARLGMRGEELMQVRRGALLHDIGKMGVPDRVLLKPGPLDEAEWEVMRAHTTIAYELLRGIPFLARALDIPYAHHERWDGGGYPRGLAGERIPLAARLFAVVDVFDALTSDRPYRPAWSRDRAIAHLQESKGTHLDPRVVDVFLAMLEEDEADLVVRRMVEGRSGGPRPRSGDGSDGLDER